MDEPRKHQVSLRGASAKEISRDALLAKVSQERELRNFSRRATSAALFLQRVWRRHRAVKVVSMQLQQQWLAEMNQNAICWNKMQISRIVLRPFIFFMTFLSTRYQRIETREEDCVKLCFRVLLESINSTDPNENFCSLVTGTTEERKIWIYQSKKLILLCLLILVEFDYTDRGLQDVGVVSLAMRLAVLLTDRKGWKSITERDTQYADAAVKNLIWFIANKESGTYNCIRRYIWKLDPVPTQGASSGRTDDRFLITASALTLALRPFHFTDTAVTGSGVLELQHAAENYFFFLFTIPWFSQRLPMVLLPALKHKSVLSSCLRSLLISKDRISKEISEMDRLEIHLQSKKMPQVAWALANIIFLATSSDDGAVRSGKFAPGLDLVAYVRFVIILAENLLACFGKDGQVRFRNQEIQVDVDNQVDPIGMGLLESETTCESLKMSYTDLLKPVYQQSHLLGLLNLEKDLSGRMTDTHQSSEAPMSFELLDVAYYYSCMIRIFSALNPVLGSLPVLNMLSFTPGFLSKLWEVLERSLFPGRSHDAKDNSFGNDISKSKDDVSQRKQKWCAKDRGNKWVNVLHKFSGNSPTESSKMNSTGKSSFDRIRDQSSSVWDVEALRRGPVGLSKDMHCLLHLFCAIYSHLLLVLDDIEFYEKQVPFTLEQQRKISSMLNTLVYNAVSGSVGPHNRTLMDSAIQCLHLLYERDCRHQFCPPALWLSPGERNRLPIAVAARTHEVLSATVIPDDASAPSSMASVITLTPHVFPFEERVEMFRELINMDKESRRMAGEVVGPGPGSVEVVIRRGHIVEDGFQQLNALGSRLKSSIHVSFISESGLPEAGLDYGGLSKEFLTDIAKAVFSPEYGLFSQSSSSDRLLIPNTAARFLENGIQMIEFLGRVVGKALYEGILLDYSFSLVFVQKLLGRYSFLDELSTLDPELYRNLMYVKHYDGDVKELSLDFTATEESLGKRHLVELKPGGKDICVTNENKLQYIHAVADYKLNRQILPFSNAFCRGLTDLVSPSWLRLFNASEFNQLLSGGNHDIDIGDLRKNTRYTGGYTEGSRTVKLFWEVVAGFEAIERCMLLKFVTSCSRGPLLGFKHLQPAFTIHKVVCDVPFLATLGGQDVDRLPSASTCYNTLKLPTYKRLGTLREKLLYAINSNAGFELS
ncbi:E3 ubiquitin-protein ligase UPL7 [Coffea arabica]|uniref:HECT-type E3 ubiquitin transferase n=1 Tax=Coffea arabica TaxID=13443 RepID=A0A6P6SX74_COFAR